jgi:hypothetical protein
MKVTAQVDKRTTMFILSQNLVNSPNLNFDTKFKEVYLRIPQKRKARSLNYFIKNPLSGHGENRNEREKRALFTLIFSWLEWEGPQEKKKSKT